MRIRRAAQGTRYVSAAEAAKVVQDGDHLVVAMASPFMTPFNFLRELGARAPGLRGVTADTSWSAGAPPLLQPGAEESFSVTSIFANTAPEAAALDARSPHMDYIPMNPSFMGALADQPHRDDLTRRFTGADVFAVAVTPPNAAGYVTFGTNLWNARVQMQNAKLAIGEVRDDLPIIPGGDNWMPASAFDYLVEVESKERAPLPAIFAPTPEDEVDASQVCCLYTAELVNNGDTVMFGGGAIPVRVAPFLEEKEDLGCHSEVIFPVELYEKGVITNRKRNLLPGKTSLTGFIPRDEAERDWADGNPAIDLRDMHVNNHPRYICQNDNLVAINARSKSPSGERLAANASGRATSAASAGRSSSWLARCCRTEGAPSTRSSRGSWRPTVNTFRPSSGNSRRPAPPASRASSPTTWSRSTEWRGCWARRSGSARKNSSRSLIRISGRRCAKRPARLSGLGRGTSRGPARASERLRAGGCQDIRG